MNATQHAAGTGLIAPLLGFDAFFLMGLGVVLAHFGITPPFIGFLVFQLGGLVAIAGIVISLVLRRRARAAGNDGSRARTGLWLSTLALIAIVLPALPSMGLPLINDITTDTHDPPVFVEVLELAPNRGRDMVYAGGHVSAQQHQAYPDLEPAKVPLAPREALIKLRGALIELPGTELVDVDLDAGRIEATSTSRLFRFVDDVVIRVRPLTTVPGATGSIVDIRSKSRDGKGDLGANAARIRKLLAALP